MTRQLLAPIAFACTLLCAAQAQAGNLTFNGYANGSETVNIKLAAPNVAETLNNVSAGGFSVAYNGGASFTSYCIDLYQYIGFNTTFNDFTLNSGTQHVFANANARADIGKLYAEGNVIDSAIKQSAFQIAIWEIAYETTGAYDLANGSATFTGGAASTDGAPSTALSLASTWLGKLSSTKNSNFAVYTLDSPGHQDQVFATPVPEPSTYALLGGGLMAIGFVARRRNGKAAR